MIRYYKVLILVTLLSLNCFARDEFNIVNTTKPISAKVAKHKTKIGRKNLEQDNQDNLFTDINRATIFGKCEVFIELEELPNNFETLLSKLGYKLEYYEFTKKERISWCD